LFFLFGLDEHFFGDDAGSHYHISVNNYRMFPDGADVAIADLANNRHAGEASYLHVHLEVSQVDLGILLISEKMKSSLVGVPGGIQGFLFRVGDPFVFFVWLAVDEHAVQAFIPHTKDLVAHANGLGSAIHESQAHDCLLFEHLYKGFPGEDNMNETPFLKPGFDDFIVGIERRGDVGEEGGVGGRFEAEDCELIFFTERRRFEAFCQEQEVLDAR
jgi:hypothetical protein